MGATLLTSVLVVAAVELALVGLLYVPVDFTLSARTGAGVGFRARWLFGLVRVGREPARQPVPPQRPAPDEAAASLVEERVESRTKRRRRSRSSRAARSVRGLLAIEGLIPRAGRLVRDLLRSFRLHQGRIAVRAGTGDPADTGQICGIVGPLLVMRPWPRSLRVEFEPDFAEATFEAEAEAAGRLVPVRFVGAIGRFVLSRPGVRAIKVMVWNGG